MPERIAPVTFRNVTRMSVGGDQLLRVLEFTLEPLVLSLSLWVVALSVNGEVSPAEVILALLVFALTFPGATRLTQSAWSVVRQSVFGWAVISGLLFVLGYASGHLADFDQDVLITWWWTAPSAQVLAHFGLRLAAPAILTLQGGLRNAVIAGMNEQAVELSKRLAADPYSRVRVTGFFDDRDPERIKPGHEHSLLGKIRDLPGYVKQHEVGLIYISLPMASQPRIVALLDALHDTTASIYFVPDIFVTDLIQGRMDTINGLPVVAVCESPFTGLNGVVKRATDIVFALLILTLASPLMLLIALGVKLTSRGPVIFRQRRYGLDGKEIIVYKFRTMTVTEDGGAIEQARQHDPRVTPLGALLRKTSLDELPQFINVLQGRMSVVGPRPHAVAHNELYRGLIKGYMQRHKVKPGITGWAQVNGYRGETETLDKMKGRIDLDLDYLRNWSVRLDAYIIARTIWIVLTRRNAY